MKILVIDIETTGFDHVDDCIVEIGMVILDLETGCMTPTFHQLVKEDHLTFSKSESWIFQNSDLKYVDVLHAGKLDINTLQGYFSMFPVTAWNCDFDFGFLESRGLKLNSLPCPMKISSNYFKLPHKNGCGLSKWPSVQEAWDSLFTAPYVEKHRGLDDALHEARIIWELHKKGIYKVDERMVFKNDD